MCSNAVDSRRIDRLRAREPSRAIRDVGGDYNALVSGPVGIDFLGSQKQLTDAQLEQITPALQSDPRFVELILDETLVTDQSIPLILSIERLKRIRVADTAITCDGITTLAANQRITFIGASPLQLTAAQARSLIESRPNLEIWRYFAAKPKRSDLQRVAADPDEEGSMRKNAQQLIDQRYHKN